VELYARLPDLGEGEIVASFLSAGASVLELGCGAGRITRQLVRLGYRVTAVDESAEMLAHVRDAEAIQARIGGSSSTVASTPSSSRAISSTRNRRAA
jgi:SAM-dependent methyltransferase